MATRTVEESSLTAVADAIRARAGTSEPLAFPEGMKDAVEGIQDNANKIADGTITSYENDEIRLARAHAFYSCTSLTFVRISQATYIGPSAFAGCTALKEAIFDKVATAENTCFSGDTSLEKVDFGAVTQIWGYSFQNCSNLKALILRRTGSVCNVSATQTFANSGIASGSGYIYVPRALVNNYKSATNWSTYASQIRAIEDYPEITGG